MPHENSSIFLLKLFLSNSHTQLICGVALLVAAYSNGPKFKCQPVSVSVSVSVQGDFPIKYGPKTLLNMYVENTYLCSIYVHHHNNYIIPHYSSCLAYQGNQDALSFLSKMLMRIMFFVRSKQPPPICVSCILQEKYNLTVNVLLNFKCNRLSSCYKKKSCKAWIYRVFKNH